MHLSARPDPVRDQIADLAGHLAGLSAEQWDAASLCEAWRVRDVVAHVVAGEQGAFGVRAVVAGLVRHRLDYNRWIALDGRSRGAQDPAVILQALRGAGAGRRAESGGAQVRALAHVLIHGQDVCRPLGIARELPGSHLLAVADFAATSIIFRARKRIAGLRLVDVLRHR